MGRRARAAPTHRGRAPRAQEVTVWAQVQDIMHMAFGEPAVRPWQAWTCPCCFVRTFLELLGARRHIRSLPLLCSLQCMYGARKRNIAI